MRISNMGVVALFAAAALYVGLWAPQAEAACQTASCVKQAAVASKSTTDATGKRTHYASRRTKLKMSHLKHETSHTSLSKALSALPPSVANARAELAAPHTRSADELDKNIAAVDENEIVTMSGVQIAAATQLNDMDRAVADQQVEVKSEEPNPEVVVTQAEPATPTTGHVVRAVPSGERQMLAHADTETWSKTSLLGKIFVAFGSLLTLASAARLILT